MSAELDDAAASRKSISLCVVSIDGEVVLRELHVKLDDYISAVDAVVLAAFREGQSLSGDGGGLTIQLTSPAGDFLSKGSTFEACGIKDGDCLTAVVHAIGFSDGVHLSSSTTYLAVSEDGRLVTKKDGPFSEASVRMADPIDRNLYCFTTRATHGSGGHIQIGFATEGGFLKGGKDRSYQRDPSTTNVWGFDTGSDCKHQFGTTKADMKPIVASRISDCTGQKTKEIITLVVQGTELWMAVGEIVCGKIADGLPVDEDLYAFVLAEPAAGVVIELLPTPADVEVALRNAIKMQ